MLQMQNVANFTFVEQTRFSLDSKPFPAILLSLHERRLNDIGRSVFSLSACSSSARLAYTPTPCALHHSSSCYAGYLLLQRRNVCIRNHATYLTWIKRATFASAVVFQKQRFLV